MSERPPVPISIRKVSKSYGSARALAAVDLDIRRGEFLTLLGPSGSGKTTLLMVLAGFIRPDSGSLLFGDREVVRLAPHKRDIGIVFQNYALFPHMDVAANIAFPLKLRRVHAPDIARRVDSALEMVKLAGLGSRRVDELSGGQRQRVALARAIVFEPSIVLMDEPLSALDKQLREAMQIELRQLHDKLGTTTIYVTHDQREALTMSDRIAVIQHGRVMQLDTPRAIYEQPANRFVAQFIGESTFLDVERVDGAYHCAGRPLKVARPVAPEGALSLVLRPEHLRLLDSGDGRADNVFDARVTQVIYQGDTLLLHATLADGRRIVARIVARNVARRATRSCIPRAGDDLRFGVDAEDTVLVAAADGI